VSALFIAVITLGGAVHEVFGLGDPLTGWLGWVDLGDAGLLLVALLMSVWAVASLSRRAPGE
jgi:high-affinity nickel-transport protein